MIHLVGSMYGPLGCQLEPLAAPVRHGLESLQERGVTVPVTRDLGWIWVGWGWLCNKSS